MIYIETTKLLYSIDKSGLEKNIVRFLVNMKRFLKVNMKV